MADLGTEVLNEIRNLINGMKGSGLFGGQQQTNAEKFRTANTDPTRDYAQRVRIERALQEGTKVLRQSIKEGENYGRNMRVAGAAFEKAIQNLSLKAFDELPARISAMTASVGLQFKTMGDVTSAATKYTEENIQALEAMIAENSDATTSMERKAELQKNIMSQLGTDATKWGNELKLMRTKGAALGNALNKETIAIEKATKKEQHMAVVSGLAATALMKVASFGVHAAMASAKYGVSMEPLLTQTKLLGTNVDEYGQVLNANIQAYSNAGLSAQQFGDQLVKGGYDLATYTGNLIGGAQITAALFQQFHMLSAGGLVPTRKYVLQQIDAFKKMHDATGETAEQFLALTSNMNQNSDIQQELYRLSFQQRIIAQHQLYQQAKELGHLGILNTELPGVVSAFAKIGAQSPQERIQTAAKLMAVGGALGMGPLTQKMGLMIEAGNTHSKAFADLEAQFQREIHARYAKVTAIGKGGLGGQAAVAAQLAQEMPLYQLTNLPGLHGLAAQTGEFAKLGTRIGNIGDHASKQRQHTHTLLGEIKTAIIDSESVLRGFGSSLVGAVSLVLGVLKGPALVKKVLTGGVNLAGKTKGLLGRFLGKGGATEAAEGGEAAEAAGGAEASGGLASLLGPAAGVLAAGAGGYFLGHELVKHTHIAQDIGGGIFDLFHGSGAPKTPVFNINKYRAEHHLTGPVPHEAGTVSPETSHQQLMERIDVIIEELAKISGQNPSQVMESLHKTLKQQHVENKQLAHQQIDATKKSKVVQEVTPPQARLGSTS